ncbi:MAG TPA: hypothetical protein VMX74_16060, partial [Pirellulales bacterium]|nr:hypothetical protein [Pirellulales bacterium]
MDGRRLGEHGGKLAQRPELERYIRLARQHGKTLRQYLEEVDSAELALQQAFERKNGPQGEEREDWRCAYIRWQIATSWGGAKGAKLEDFLPSFEIVEEPELIDDDPELCERREKELFTK